ncbi:hypothetical protein Golomagni_08223, partial [Golovinomyces magnicellulatus]
MANVMDITIISDNVCPFCYIGRKRLDHALSLFRKTVPGASGLDVRVQWHAFLLDRNPPAESVSYKGVAEKRFGADRIPQKLERLKQAGASEGINFTLEGRIGATRDSHRLAHLGKTKGWQVQDRLVMEIMHMFFEEGGDITSWDDLVKAAVKAGIDSDEARDWLANGNGGEEVDRELAAADARGIHGVPKFIINSKFEVDGADDMFEFLEQLNKAKEDME